MLDEKMSTYVVMSESSYRDPGSEVEVRLVYSTRTATVTVLPTRVVDAVQTGHHAALPASLASQLRRAQLLVPADEDERDSVLRRNAEAAADLRHLRYILLPTSMCNMGCTYCGQEHRTGAQTGDHRGAVKRRILDALELPATESVSVEWFGAEPMMGYASIKDISATIIAEADARGIAYSSEMVTNGSLLNPTNVATLVHRCRVTKFYITLDGPAHVHDVHRPLKRGGGSFDRIVAIVRHVLDQPDLGEVQFDLRTNVDVHNQDHISDYLQALAEAGLSSPRVRLDLTRVRPWGNDVSQIEIINSEFAEQELRWLSEMRSWGLHYMRMPTLAKKVTCPAVSSGTQILDAQGQIYSCTDHPLVPGDEQAARLGTVVDVGIPTMRPRGEFDDWHETVARGEVGCSRCTFLPTCGGSCPKSWAEGNLPCPPYKFNHQGRLSLMADELGLVPVGR